MTSRLRRRLLVGGTASVLAGMCPPGWSQVEWPGRPVRIISPYGAGGSNDIAARILSEELGRRLGQQFNVENRPGAGTRLANEMVARSAADGYTLLFAAAPFATAEAMSGKLSYDPKKDLHPVSLSVVAPIFLIVNAQSPFKSVQDLIAYGKSKPDGLTFASPGAGSGPHLAAELLFRETGSKGLNVHYRGDATAYTELLAGRVDATLTAISAALPHIQSGKLRVLGVASEVRSAVYPQAATLKELGLVNVMAYGWFGFIAPAGTPKSVVERLHGEVQRALAESTVKQRLLGLGLEPRGSTPAEFSTFIDAEAARWGDVIRKAGIKGD
jgi:tripartite-type tricarboxylate transporter receptor subunit TctC